LILRPLVEEEVRRVLAQAQNNAPWMSTEEAAQLLGTTPGAVRQRIHKGWLRGDTVKDGRNVLLNRKALLADLEARRR
jgi:excisionase family DNA binding protein